MSCVSLVPRWYRARPRSMIYIPPVCRFYMVCGASARIRVSKPRATRSDLALAQGERMGAAADGKL